MIGKIIGWLVIGIVIYLIFGCGRNFMVEPSTLCNPKNTYSYMFYPIPGSTHYGVWVPGI